MPMHSLGNRLQAKGHRALDNDGLLYSHGRQKVEPMWPPYDFSGGRRTAELYAVSRVVGAGWPIHLRSRSRQRLGPPPAPKRAIGLGAAARWDYLGSPKPR